MSSGLPGLDVPMMYLKNTCPRCTESESLGAELASALQTGSLGIPNEVEETSPGKDLERCLPSKLFMAMQGISLLKRLWACGRLAENGRWEGSRLSIREPAFQGAALTWGQIARVPTLVLSPTSSITLTKVI